MHFNFSFKKSHLVAMALVFTFISCKKDIDVEPVLNKNSFLLNEIPLAANDPRQSPKVMLGSKIFNDANLSVSGDGQQLMVQSCASCHLDKQGYAGYANKVVSIGATFSRRFIGGFGEGAVAGRFGGRLAMSAAYASFSPKLHRPDLHEGLPNVENEFFGGNFWDGRATGHRLGMPTAEQAQGPFLNPVEQNHPNSHAVLLKIEQNLNDYYSVTATKTLWEEVFGQPLKVSNLSPTDPKVQEEYDRLGYAIAAYEASNLVNKFSSKYDNYLNKNEDNDLLTKQERSGMKYYQKYCGSCHPSEKGKDGQAPLFTDFGFDNIGVPATTAHPLNGGILPVDLGLGGFLERTTLPAMAQYAKYAEGAKGKFMTPTVRNAAKGELMSNGQTNRAYMHNGVFTSLEEVVHFYNTRSVPGEGWSKTAGKGQDPRKKTTPGFKPWPAPEYPATFNSSEVGNMGLKVEQELEIVAFMKTLVDK